MATPISAQVTAEKNHQPLAALKAAVEEHLLQVMETMDVDALPQRWVQVAAVERRVPLTAALAATRESQSLGGDHAEQCLLLRAEEEEGAHEGHDQAIQLSVSHQNWLWHAKRE